MAKYIYNKRNLESMQLHELITLKNYTNQSNCLYKDYCASEVHSINDSLNTEIEKRINNLIVTER